MVEGFFEDMSEKTSYSAAHRLIEIAAIAGYLAILVVAAHRLFMHDMWSDPAVFGWAFTALFAGFVCADFVSGFVHWLADSFGHPDMPILGQAFVRPFREHHVDPKDITHHDFVEVNGNNCICILLFLPFVGTLHAFSTPAFALWLEGWTFAFTVAIFFTNQIHSWAHADERPAFVRALQRTGLILSPEHHGVHHTAPYDRYFCITFGWLNPLLTKIDFFGRLYRLFKGNQPHPGTQQTTSG